MKTSLLTLAAVLVTVGCGIFYDLSFASVSNDTSRGGASFVLACRMETIEGASVARLSYDHGKLSVQIDDLKTNQNVTLINPPTFEVTDAYVSASWPEEAFAFEVESAADTDSRVFSGYFSFDAVRVVASCFKIVTSERDADEFSLYCVPDDGLQSSKDGVELAEVVLSYEERELEMLMNPTTKGEILDFERTTDLSVTDSMIEGSWDLERVRFQASRVRGDRYAGTLTHGGKSTVSLVCWRI